MAGQGTPAGPCQHCNRVIVLLFAGFKQKSLFVITCYFVIIVSCLLCSDLKSSSFLHLLISTILEVCVSSIED